MQLTGVGQGNVMAGVYTSPYTGTINGVSSTIICDDFTDDTFFWETWKATESTVTNLGTTRFDVPPPVGHTQQNDYDAAAALAILLLQTSDPTQKGYISFAIWNIFSPAAVAAWLQSNNHDPSSTIYNAATGYATKALNGTLSGTYSSGGFDGVSFSNVDVYTPIAGSAKGCYSDGSCPKNSPQEFMAISAPEAPAPLVLAVDLLVLLAVVVVFRRRTGLATK
jgi:hypothetical protein